MEPEAFELFNKLGDNFDETTFPTDNCGDVTYNNMVNQKLFQ